MSRRVKLWLRRSVEMQLMQRSGSKRSKTRVLVFEGDDIKDQEMDG